MEWSRYSLHALCQGNPDPDDSLNMRGGKAGEQLGWICVGTGTESRDMEAWTSEEMVRLLRPCPLFIRRIYKLVAKWDCLFLFTFQTVQFQKVRILTQQSPTD